MQASVIVLLGLVVLGGLLYVLNDALPLPASLERWISAIATFIRQEVLAVEIALILAIFLIIKWWRSSRTG